MSEAQSSARSARPVAASGGAEASARATSSRQLAVLGGLGAVLLALIFYVVLPTFTGGGASPRETSRNRPAAPAKRGAQAAVNGVVDVRLDRLAASRTEPLDGGRNPFRLGSAPPPPGQAAAASNSAPPTSAAPAVPVGPPPPPAVPAIPLKFIGLITGAQRTGKIAVLSDGRNVMSGREGAEVDGRYRIVRIGEESIQVEYLDGRGRQTIRLTGQ